MMWTRRVILALALFGFTSGAAAQTPPGDTTAERLIQEIQAARVAALDSARHATAARLLDVADELATVPPGRTRARTTLLAEAQRLAATIAERDGDLAFAAAAERGDAPDRLATAPALASLARIVAHEHARLMARDGLRDELRLFLGGLRLFDETGMPPTARGGDGGEPDPGCPVTSCPIGGVSPADVPLTHAEPGAGGAGHEGGAEVVTPASLSRLLEQLAVVTDSAALADAELARGRVTVTREAVLGAGATGFRSGGEGIRGLGPRAGLSFLLSRSLGHGVSLTLEPGAGARSLQAEHSTFTELAAELRGTLAGTLGGGGAGGAGWQVTSWQKGRVLTDPLPAPGYLEPGRAEGGLAGRLTVPIHGRWALELQGGGDLVRYEPRDWRALDRQGLSTAAGAAWRGDGGSARLVAQASRHGFARPEDGAHPRREDTRLGLEADVAVEGRVVVRLTAGAGWNDSRLAAYDFRSQRAAVVVSAPWAGGSVQAYGALAHLAYRDPGTGDGGMAPSDQDRGSLVAVQYTRPLDATRAVSLRAEWSRSETGYRDDFYQRFGTSVQIRFRGYGG